MFSVGSVFLNWPCGNCIKGRGGVDKLGVVRWVWFYYTSYLRVLAGVLGSYFVLRFYDLLVEGCLSGFCGVIVRFIGKTLV